MTLLVFRLNYWQVLEMSSPEKKFDLHYLHAQLSAVYEKSSKLDMDSYIKAYTEFNKYYFDQP
jgi:hypothetical protein